MGFRQAKRARKTRRFKGKRQDQRRFGVLFETGKEAMEKVAKHVWIEGKDSVFTCEECGCVATAPIPWLDLFEYVTFGSRWSTFDLPDCIKGK